jgi:hypothetical protein
VRDDLVAFGKDLLGKPLEPFEVLLGRPDRRRRLRTFLPILAAPEDRVGVSGRDAERRELVDLLEDGVLVEHNLRGCDDSVVAGSISPSKSVMKMSNLRGRSANKDCERMDSSIPGSWARVMPHGIQPSPTRAARRGEALEWPPSQIGGRGCCLGFGSKTIRLNWTYLPSNTGLSLVQSSMIASRYSSMIAPRSAKGTLSSSYSHSM